MVQQRYAEKGGSRAGSTTVGVASGRVMPFNTKRVEAVLVNDSPNLIYLSLGEQAAVVGAGIRLNANGGSAVIEADNNGRIWKGAIQAIATIAGSNLSWSEDW